MTEHQPPEHSARLSPDKRKADEELTLSERVIYELATAQNVKPIEMDWPLNDSVDPDALDALFAPRHDGTPRAGSGSVEFSSNGYRVVVRKNGDVHLQPTTDSPV